MTPDTQTVTTGFPLVIPTKSKLPTARLVLRNDLGQVVQQWLIRQNKVTLGSAASCGVRCEAPGIAPYHAMIVVGARQIFIRALAPRLTRQGLSVSELLLTDAENHFEIAGHEFSLIRRITEQRAASIPDSDHADARPGRLKFTLARPFEISQSSARQSKLQAAAPSTEVPQVADNKWIARMVQEAIEPLECQLQNVLEPLNELQKEARKQRQLQKQLFLESNLNRRTDRHDELPLPKPDPAITRLPDQMDQLAAAQSATVELMSEHISSVTKQLSVIEQLVHQEHPPKGIAESIERDAVQNNAIEQLQSGMLSVSHALQDLENRQQVARHEDLSWKSEVQTEISCLREAVQEVAERNAKLATTPDSVNAVLANWRVDVQDQFVRLQALIEQVAERSETARSTPQEAAQEAAWKNDVQEQFASIRGALETVSEQTRRELPSPQEVSLVDELTAEDKAWKHDVQEQFASIHATLQEVAEQSRQESLPTPAVPLTEEQIAEEMAWKHQVQDQFASIHAALEKVAEQTRPESPPTPAASLIEEQIAEEMAWKHEVQEQFASIRAALEIVTQQALQESPATAAIPQSEESAEDAAWRREVQEQLASIRLALDTVSEQSRRELSSIPALPTAPSVEAVENSLAESECTIERTQETTQSSWESIDSANEPREDLQVTQEYEEVSKISEIFHDEDFVESFESIESFSAPRIESELSGDEGSSSDEAATVNAELTQAETAYLPDNDTSDDPNFFETGHSEHTSESQFFDEAWDEPTAETGGHQEHPPSPSFNSFGEFNLPTDGNPHEFAPQADSFQAEEFEIESQSPATENYSTSADTIADFDPAAEKLLAEPVEQSSAVHRIPQSDVFTDGQLRSESDAASGPNQAETETGKPAELDPPCELDDAESPPISNDFEAIEEFGSYAADPGTTEAAQTGIDDLSPRDAEEGESEFYGFSGDSEPDQTQEANEKLLGPEEAYLPSLDTNPYVDDSETDNGLPSWWTEEEANARSAESPDANSAMEDELLGLGYTPDIPPAPDSELMLEATGRSDDIPVSNESENQPESSETQTKATGNLFAGGFSELEEDPIIDDSSLSDDSPHQRDDVPSLSIDPQQPQDTPAEAVSPADGQAAGDDDSVEDYMRKLLARMRGVSEDEVELQPSAARELPNQPAPIRPSRSQGDDEAHSEDRAGRPTVRVGKLDAGTGTLSDSSTEPFDPNSYIPRMIAPEKVQNMAAMRELANSSARTAIHRSSQKRHLTSILLKASISLVGMVVAGILIAINGFQVNIGLVATVAAFLVAAIWGYDALSSLKPFIQSNIVLSPQAEIRTEVKDSESAEADSDSDSESKPVADA